MLVNICTFASLGSTSPRTGGCPRGVDDLVAARTRTVVPAPPPTSLAIHSGATKISLSLPTPHDMTYPANKPHTAAITDARPSLMASIYPEAYANAFSLTVAPKTLKRANAGISTAYIANSANVSPYGPHARSNIS